jgi:hypothetical protein
LPPSQTVERSLQTFSVVGAGAKPLALPIGERMWRLADA